MSFTESEQRQLRAHADFIEQFVGLKSDLPMARLLVLLKVAIEPEKISQTFIEETGISSAAISRHLGFWRKCGNVATKVAGPSWIDAVVDPGDCRTKLLNLSPHGLLELKKILGEDGSDQPERVDVPPRGTTIQSFKSKRRNQKVFPQKFERLP